MGAVILLAGDRDAGASIAVAVGLAVLYFTVVSLLLTARRDEHRSGQRESGRE